MSLIVSHDSCTCTYTVSHKSLFCVYIFFNLDGLCGTSCATVISQYGKGACQYLRWESKCRGRVPPAGFHQRNVLGDFCKDECAGNFFK